MANNYRWWLMSEENEKVRENRLRRMADRQGLRLQKSRRRDPRALDYGTYMLLDVQNRVVATDLADLDEVEARLTGRGVTELWHWTSPALLAQIIRDGKIKPHRDGDIAKVLPAYSST